MANYSPSLLVVKSTAKSGSIVPASFNINSVTDSSFKFIVSLIQEKSLPAAFGQSVYIVADIGRVEDQPENFANSFFFVKSFAGKGRGDQRIQARTNTSGQLYPTTSNPFRSYAHLDVPSLIRTLAAYEIPRYDQPIREDGQIYPVFVPADNRVRDWELPAEPLLQMSTGVAAILARVPVLLGSMGSCLAQYQDSLLLSDRKIHAESLSLNLQGGLSYYLDQYSSFVSAGPLIETVSGQEAGFKRGITLKAEPLVETLSVQNLTFDESTYFRNWAIQSYGWDPDLLVDWWAD